jgi:hypothetical protein
MEVDADIQGLGFLQSHWDVVFENACRNDSQLPEEQQAAEIFEALLRTPRTRFFMTTVSVTIGIFLLGFKEWAPTQLLQKSHPLSVVRLLVLIRAAAQRVDGEDEFDLLKNESADALLFIHAVVGWLILRARTMGGDSNFAKELANQPADERLNFLVHQTGMFEAINYSEEIGKHLQELGSAYESVSSIREKAQRWSTESLVRWTNSTQIQK